LAQVVYNFRIAPAVGYGVVNELLSRYVNPYWLVTRASMVDEVAVAGLV